MDSPETNHIISLEESKGQRRNSCGMRDSQPRIPLRSMSPPRTKGRRDLVRQSSQRATKREASLKSSRHGSTTSLRSSRHGSSRSPRPKSGKSCARSPPRRMKSQGPEGTLDAASLQRRSLRASSSRQGSFRRPASGSKCISPIRATSHCSSRRLAMSTSMGPSCGQEAKSPMQAAKHGPSRRVAMRMTEDLGSYELVGPEPARRLAEDPLDEARHHRPRERNASDFAMSRMPPRSISNPKRNAAVNANRFPPRCISCPKRSAVACASSLSPTLERQRREVDSVSTRAQISQGALEPTDQGGRLDESEPEEESEQELEEEEDEVESDISDSEDSMPEERGSMVIRAAGSALQRLTLATSAATALSSLATHAASSVATTGITTAATGLSVATRAASSVASTGMSTATTGLSVARVAASSVCTKDISTAAAGVSVASKAAKTAKRAAGGTGHRGFLANAA